jgi:hypothetical protein
MMQILGESAKRKFRGGKYEKQTFVDRHGLSHRTLTSSGILRHHKHRLHNGHYIAADSGDYLSDAGGYSIDNCRGDNKAV